MLIGFDAGTGAVARPSSEGSAIPCPQSEPSLTVGLLPTHQDQLDTPLLVANARTALLYSRSIFLIVKGLVL